MDQIKSNEGETIWGDKSFHDGFDAALDRTRRRLIEYGGDEDGNIPLQVVFDALQD